MSIVHAVLIGVAEPGAVRWSEEHAAFIPADDSRQTGDYRFEPLDGVGNDLDAYFEIVSGDADEIVRLESAVDTTLEGVTKELSRHADAENPCACEVLVIVLVGHGFQVQTYDDSEPDRMDEFFALSDLPLIDDWWVPFWKNARTELKAAVIVDSCHSETIVLGMNAPDPLVIPDQTSAGPRRVVISASLDEQKAREYSFGCRVQGLLTFELLNAWSVPESRNSYSSWFAEAGAKVNNAMQTAVMRVIDPTLTVHYDRPFQ